MIQKKRVQVAQKDSAFKKRKLGAVKKGSVKISVAKNSKSANLGKKEKKFNSITDTDTNPNTNSNSNDIEALVEAAWDVRENAYCPYSKFKVGSSMRSKETGRIYSGCNVENAAYPSSICAERGALMQAIAKEGPKF